MYIFISFHWTISHSYTVSDSLKLVNQCMSKGIGPDYEMRVKSDDNMLKVKFSKNLKKQILNKIN